MKIFSSIDVKENGGYLKLLSAIAKLSGLFSDNTVPFINYRVVENIFCRSFGARNLSRSDTAFDAQLGALGVGLKTFICANNSSVEKIAEFNALAPVLSECSGKELAVKLSEFRNARIQLSNRLYNIENSIYHIVARQEKKLVLFDTDYNEIDTDHIRVIKDRKASLHFEDGKNFYSYNYSKSTLYRKFLIPLSAYSLDIEILEDPYSLLLGLLGEDPSMSFTRVPSRVTLQNQHNVIYLPLYSTRSSKPKSVPEKSGLNQWNASGRTRNYGEVYIPIPKVIHTIAPGFFPPRNTPFNLKVPSGDILSAKVCQDGNKALMTNPNKALSSWLLRTVFALKEGELLTIEKMNELGFDSVVIVKHEDGSFEIDKAKMGSYEEFLSKNKDEKRSFHGD